MARAAIFGKNSEHRIKTKDENRDRDLELHIPSDKRTLKQHLAVATLSLTCSTDYRLVIHCALCILCLDAIRIISCFLVKLRAKRMIGTATENGHVADQLER